MKNQTLINASREILKTLLNECTEPQQLNFKRMYSHKNINLSIDEVVDNMDVNKIDWAISQVEQTLGKRIFF